MDFGNVKSLEIPDGIVKQIAVNGVVLWKAASGLTFVPILPDDVNTYPMYRKQNNKLFFAVEASNDSCGYYCPATEEFTAESGMSGTVIERCEYVSFDGSAYVTTGYQLTGADTVEVDFLYTKTGMNIFGSWHSNNQDVYTLYASTASSYVRYDSSLYRNTPLPINERLTFRMTPTGDYVGDTRYHTWAQGDFNTETNCIVGWLNGSGSPKLDGNVYDFLIENHAHLVPVKVGTAFYLFDIMRWEMPVHSGTLGGGDVISEPIPFPTTIPEDPVLLTMGE